MFVDDDVGDDDDGDKLHTQSHIEVERRMQERTRIETKYNQNFLRGLTQCPAVVDSTLIITL